MSQKEEGILKRHAFLQMRAQLDNPVQWLAYSEKASVIFCFEDKVNSNINKMKKYIESEKELYIKWLW